MASGFLPAEIWGRPKQPYRAPTTPALFGTDAPNYVSDLLSDSSLDDLGLVDCGGARRLVAKARKRAGRMSGEREEMALVGLLTLQLLGHFFMRDFTDRATEARRNLDTCKPSVLEDLSSVRSGEIPSAD